MEEQTIIEKAIALLQPIQYKPHSIGYYVVKNDDDMGDSDYCEKCIPDAIKQAKKFHKEQRNLILDKFKQISETGYFKEGRKKIIIKGKYTKKQIAQAKRYELKEYPAKVKFTYEGHDPDFGGGLKEPCGCEYCGEYFSCNFESDKNNAENLLMYMNHTEPLTDMDKWEIEVALGNYAYCDDDAKDILKEVAETILNSDKIKKP